MSYSLSWCSHLFFAFSASFARYCIINWMSSTVITLSRLKFETFLLIISWNSFLNRLPSNVDKRLREVSHFLGKFSLRVQLFLRCALNTQNSVQYFVCRRLFLSIFHHFIFFVSDTKANSPQRKGNLLLVGFQFNYLLFIMISLQTFFGGNINGKPAEPECLCWNTKN